MYIIRLFSPQTERCEQDGLYFTGILRGYDDRYFLYETKELAEEAVKYLPVSHLWLVESLED